MVKMIIMIMIMIAMASDGRREHDCLQSESLFLPQEEVKGYDREHLLDAIREAAGDELCLRAVDQSEKHGDPGAVLSDIALGAVPEEQVTEEHEEAVGQIRLNQDGPARVQPRELENVKRARQVCRVYGIPQLVLWRPFPRQVDATVDPVIRGLRPLPQLVRMGQVPRQGARLRHSEDNEPGHVAFQIKVQPVP